MKRPADKLQHKQTVLIERTALALNLSEAAAAQLFSLPRRQSFRINRLKVRHNEVVLKQLASLGWQGQAFDWYSDGFTINGPKRPVSDSRLSQEGAIYVQNAASWLPVLALDPRPGDKILDMCAAPGGKAAHILELTDNQAEVWVNDNSRPRLAKLQANFQRLGATAAHISLFDVKNLASKLADEQFDKILLDAPCSGEGMIDLTNPKALTTWSVAHIRRLQLLQRRAIQQANQLLKPGGSLIYSTCTIAPEENEVIVDYAVRKLGLVPQPPLNFVLANQHRPIQTWHQNSLDPSVSTCLRLNPSPDIEAFFVAKLIKPAGSNILDHSPANLL